MVSTLALAWIGLMVVAIGVFRWLGYLNQRRVP